MYHNYLYFLFKVFLYTLCCIPLATASELCREQDGNTVLSNVNKRVVRLRVANFNADLALMTQEYTELESYLTSCDANNDPTKLKGNSLYIFACGAECHRQMASYQLFMARDYGLLSQRADQSVTQPSTRLKHVNTGLEWIERGLAVLPLQQAVKKATFAQSQSEDTNSDGGNFNRYLANLTKLRIMRLYLLMAGGDLWYQTVSQPRLKRLDYLVGQVVQHQAGANDTCANEKDTNKQAACEAEAQNTDANMQKAVGYYEEALWMLIEAKTDIPDKIDQNFSGPITQLNALEQDLQRRRESVQQGLLYIGIDPDRYTRLPFNVLTAELEKVSLGLGTLEANVIIYMKEWEKQKAIGQQGEKADQQAQSAMAMQISGHKIGKLQTQLDQAASIQQEQQLGLAQQRSEMQAAYEQDKANAERGALTAQMETAVIAHTSRLREIQVELQQQLAAKQQEQTIIAKRGEQDLLALDIKAQEEKRNELRWMIDFDIAKTNLLVQIEALDAQLIEYNRQIMDNDTVLLRLAEQQTQLAAENKQLQEQIQQAEEQIKDFTKQRNQMFELRKASYQAQICGIQASLTIFGETIPADPHNNGLDCGINTSPAAATGGHNLRQTQSDIQQLKASFNQDQVKYHAFVLKCVIGDLTNISNAPAIACPNPGSTQIALAKKIWDTELAVAQKQVARYETVRTTLLGHIKKFKDYVDKFNDTKRSLESAVAVAEGVYQSLASSPVAGMTIDLGAPAQRVYELAKSKLELGLKWVDNEMEKVLKDGQLAEKLQQAEAQLAKLDAKKIQDEIAQQRTLAQLEAETQGEGNKLKQRIYEQDITYLQGAAEAADLANRISGLHAEHERLRADLALASQDNQLLDVRIAEQQSRIRQLRSQIQQVESRGRELDIEQQAKQADNHHIDKLKDSVEKRKNMSSELKNRVEERGNASIEITANLGQLNAQFYNGSMTLNQEEQQSLKLAMEQDQQQALTAANKEEATFKQAQTENAAKLEQRDKLDNFQQSQLELTRQEQSIAQKGLAFQIQTLQAIQNEKEQMLKNAQTDFSKMLQQTPAMDQVFANAGELSQLMDGVPEFLNSKGALLDRANTLLHLLRTKAIVIANLSSRDITPIYSLNTSSEIPYILTKSQLDDTLQPLIDGVKLNASQVKTSGTRFTIPATSGLFQALASGESIRFELRPGGLHNEEAGYFNLWNSQLDNAKDAHLLDVWIGITYVANAPSACTDSSGYTLYHLGSGFVFTPSSANATDLLPAFSWHSLRNFFNNAYNLNDSAERKLSNNRRNHWVLPVHGGYTVYDFITAGEGANPKLPFIGLPLSANYELKFDVNADCPPTMVQELELNFVYSSSANSRL